MAIQHYLTMIGAIVAIPFILTPALCMEDENPARGTIISTMIFVTGIVTIFQATFGCRLPLVQGGTISFLVPTLAILNLEKWKCPDGSVIAGMSADEKEELWMVRMRYEALKMPENGTRSLIRQKFPYNFPGNFRRISDL